MQFFVTGGAGFIGSHVVDRLLQDDHTVTVYDNFSTGQEGFLKHALPFGDKLRIERGDILDLENLSKAMAGSEFVFHLAANADVREGFLHPQKDLKQNTIATFNVLEAMRTNNISQIAFSSTSAVYGDTMKIPTKENAEFPVQTSLYGASKLASEGLIEAYSGGYGFQAFIFRLVSIVGERYSHGHIFDFYKALKRNPKQLKVMGNGKQKKSFLYIKDCLDAFFLAIEKAEDRVNILNVGSREYCSISESVEWIVNHLGVKPTIHFTEGNRGWIGDNPFVFLDCKKLVALGWAPKTSIREGIIRTIDYISDNEWILDARS